MTLVIDSSTVVAALIDSGALGDWAESQLTSAPLAVPYLMAVEAANVLRRAELAGQVSADVASLAHADLLALPAQSFPYEPFAERVWALRHNMTCYDAWYVALAESLDAPLATLDRRLAAVKGLRCRFVTPPPS